MIEEILIEYLNEKDIPAYTQKPSNLTEFVVVSKAGSSKENHIDSATVAIQSYSDSLYKAAALNEIVKDAMEEITERDDVSSCKLNSDYNWTDTTTKEFRYQAIFDIVYFKEDN